MTRNNRIWLAVGVAVCLALSGIAFAVMHRGGEGENEENYYASLSGDTIEYYLYIESSMEGEPIMQREEGASTYKREGKPEESAESAIITLLPSQIADQIKKGMEYDTTAYEEWASNFTKIPTTVFPVVLENETTFNIPMPRSLADVFNRTTFGTYIEQFSTVFMQRYFPHIVAGEKGLVNVPNEGVNFFVSGLSRITERLNRGSEELYKPEFEAIEAVQPFNIPSGEMQEAGETVEQLFEKETSGERLSILNRLTQAAHRIAEPDPTRWSPFQEMSEPALAANGYSRIDSPEWHFSANYPKDWSLQRVPWDSGNGMSFFIGPEKQMDIDVGKPGEGVDSVDKFVDFLLGVTGQDVSKAKLGIVVSNTTLGGEPARKVVMGGTRNGIPFQSKLIVALHNGTGYSIGGTGPTQLAERIGQIPYSTVDANIEAIASSFKFA